MSVPTPLFPAIDLRGGLCVRLMQGDYGRGTVYGDDPVTRPWPSRRQAPHGCTSWTLTQPVQVSR